MLLARTTGEWIHLNPSPQRRWYALFFNPAANHFHACNNLLERLILEVEEGQKPRDLVSYELVEDLVGERLSADDPALSQFEFKIQVNGEDYLVSPAVVIK